MSLSAADNAPVQPIPYSHRQHIAAGLKCGDCHTPQESGELLTIPQSARCMICHQAIKRESPAVEKLAGYHRDKRPIPWVRVYEIPSYVRFGHKAHLDAGATCQKCHGPVETREALARDTDISMNGCMSCHRESRADISCTYCHDKMD